MITAQNKLAPNDSGQDTDKSAPVIGFGKVLHSIHGLQQRLGDFSIEDVSRAETNANTLIRRLALLQDRLMRITDLKHALTETAATVGRIPEPDLDQIGPASLEKHPQLHAIVKANKLIRLHRLLKIARASAQSVSFDADAGRLDVTSPLAPAVTPPKEKKYPKPTASAQTDAKKAKSASDSATDKNSSTGVIELPPPPPTAIQLGAPRDLADEQVAEATEDAGIQTRPDPEPQTVQNDYRSSSAPTVSMGLREKDTVSPVSIDASLEMEMGPDETLSDPHGASQITAQAPPARDQKAPVAPAQTVSSIAPATQRASDLQNERASTTISEVFDQRLLDELIQIYGEFAPVAEASKPNTAPSAPRVETVVVKPDAAAPKVEPGALRVEPTAPRFETAAVHVETTLPPEPKFVTAEPVAMVETATVEVGVPVKSRGDLDRQLKKIIQDYGEYDLYSHTSRSSVALKRGGIAAFVVLGLVLGGVYFLRSPNKITPQVDSGAPSSQESSPAAPQAAKENPSGIAGDAVTTRDTNKKLNGAEKAPGPAKTKTQLKQ